MKTAVCFMYVLCQFIYLAFGEGNRYWGGFNIITHIGFVGFLCYFIEKEIKNITDNERLFFTYLKFLSAANCVYILFCIIKKTSFAIHNTDVFAFILAIGFVSFLIQCALKKS